MTDIPNQKPHHHGDLRSALIQAGIALLSEGGKDALTLRKCAARAGVSHAAPAHHFDGLDGLRGAIAQEGFRLFRLSMLAACDDNSPSGLDHLKGICSGYLNFAIKNPALFELIFSSAPMAGLDRDLKQGTAFAYEVLRDACAPFVLPGQDPQVVETQVWSLIHGYTHLYMASRFGPVDPLQQARGPFDAVMALLDKLVVTLPKA
ncbi:TetR/AcrR family transcriptional regulator [Parasedimentitalea psychrophila]|uniref:TetR/AcrR family transcriptional regulator n=1 Tax=Parasedimentitalea psychrophila TaxID=2997337 RepID=A0A9Y2P788_9RHOB|nr:TetR/AcrR family transcriptional regulator [Parasedimentitalea psychrophila]WIY25545.1 TetR/AcrR family transcriptional regulator [Parasedimentitalea psychrophila]